MTIFSILFMLANERYAGLGLNALSKIKTVETIAVIRILAGEAMPINAAIAD